MKSVTVSAPINIALIKYWGKQDEENIIPLNGSISLTLHQEQLRSVTTVRTSPEFKCHKLILNGREASITKRIQRVIEFMQEHARRLGRGTLANHKIEISSENNFPTAAGMASSASGMAALAYALAKLYDVEEEYVSIAARIGSGSACRSIYGGIVEWRLDEKNLLNSASHQLYDESYWSQLRVMICVMSECAKDTGSTPGMQRTVETSTFMAARLQSVVKKQTDRLLKSLADRNLPLLAEVAMQESNQLHAVCLDTWPPIFYMTDQSRSVVRFVLAVNEYFKKIVVGYTFDAGANAFLIMEETTAPLIFHLLCKLFGPEDLTSQKEFIRGYHYPKCSDTTDEQNISKLMPPSLNTIKMIISTKIGPGPQVL